MNRVLQDIRFAMRSLARSPGFTALALFTLALGIGANTAIFSVVNGVLLRSLPFTEPDRLVKLYTAYPNDETHYPLSAPDFMSYHDDARPFSGVAAYDESRQTLTGTGEPTRVDVALVSRGFFQLLGARPMLGRTFRPEENEPGRNTVALLTHAFWRQRYGADPGVLGSTLTLNGVQRTIVGVLPPEFDFPAKRQIYYPLAYNSSFSSTTAERRRSEFLGVVARLKPGVSMERARTEVRTISDRLQREFPETNPETVTLSMVPLRDELLGPVRAPLLILLGAVGLVLLIACVNVANLLLVRATAREGELAVRAALGAGRGRLVRQLLTESVLLGLVGGALGLLLAVWGTHALVAARPEGIPRLDEIRMDVPVLAFALAVSLVTGLLFGLIPAVQITRGDLTGTLREGGRGSMAGRGANRARRALVVAEMALAVVLLVGAGLLIRSFLRLTAVDPGFRTERVVGFDLALPQSAYGEEPQIRQFYARLLERLAALPGVKSVGAASELPLSGMSNIFGFSIEKRPAPPPGFVQDAAVVSATPGYFETLGIPLRRGRALSEQDRVDSPPVAIANEAFVRRYFPGENPLGRRVSFDDEQWVEIVGVVGDVPQKALDRSVRPALYLPHAQSTRPYLAIALRTSGDPLALTQAIRREVRALDPNLPVEKFTTTRQLVAESVARPRFYMVLLAIFAAVALLLAAVGIFGVMSYMVTQRTREIGVRIALGADPGSVLRTVVGGALALAGIGVAVGLLAALASARLLSSLLFGVGATDPVTFAAVVAVLLGVAALASYLPARTAVRVHPSVALRHD